MTRKAIGLLIITLLFMPRGSDSLSSGWLTEEKQYQSAVQIWTLEKNKPRFLCSGVAIAPDTVITAKSCTSKKTHADTLFVSTASLDYNVTLTQALKSVASVAKKGVPHPDADLMLIFLNQWLTVEPALLLTPSEAFQIRLLPPVFLVGFGRSNWDHLVDPNIGWWDSFWGKKTPTAPGQKITANSQIVQVETRELRLGSSNDDGGSCAGDEGGPVYAHIETPFANSLRVVGILTASDNQKSCAKPSHALRLDAFLDFINNTMVEECRAKERIWCQVEGLINPGYIDLPEEEPVEKKTEHVVFETESFPNEQRPIPVPEPQALPPPPPSPVPVPSAPPPQKPIKRRLALSAEGVGCSCQQVLSKSRR